MSGSLDTEKLERAVESMYRDVADSAEGEFHFETGRDLAGRLGYDPDTLAYVPDEAIDSFAGVGYHFDVADLEPREDVLDLGSGSGMDAFYAAMNVTETGSVTGVDLTPEQVEKADDLAADNGFYNVSFRRGYIEDLPFDDGSFDAAISNGVVNLSAEKDRVFEEAYRVLRPGGLLALSDVVSERRMPGSIKTDADLWAACIGGATQVDRYTDLVESAGFEVVVVEENADYEFVSEQAANACRKYGVKSISLSARKQYPRRDVTDGTYQTDTVSRRTVLKTTTIAVGGFGVAGTAAAGDRGVTRQKADVFGQGPGGPVVAPDGATLERTNRSISTSLSMPTPEPGSYQYPSGPAGGAWTDEEGPPEVFSLWCFHFDPARDSPGGDWTGVYAAAGHVTGGPHLTLTGGVPKGADPFVGDPLEHPRDAPVRLAVAPHGALDPDLLPEALGTPTQPGPDIWWMAEFGSD